LQNENPSGIVIIKPGTNIVVMISRDATGGDVSLLPQFFQAGIWYKNQLYDVHVMNRGELIKN
jgi:hypothetical protein